MKKTGFIAAVAALSAAAGALAVGAVYLRRREKELDEYEELLFGEGLGENKDSVPAEEIVEVEIEPVEASAEEMEESTEEPEQAPEEEPAE